MPQKVIPCLSFSINGLQIENVYNFNFLGLTINCHLDWKPHLNSIGIKIAGVIGLLRKLNYTLPTQVLRSIYNSLILPHMHYIRTFSVGNAMPQNKIIAKEST